jgi:outer membrane immunogenic protein
MRNLLLSTVALMGLTAGAMAADLPMRAAPPAPIAAAVPVFTWTGFYVGVNAGFAFSDNDVGGGTLVTPSAGGGTFAVEPATGTSFNRDRNDDGGFTGGGQIGYNMQFGMFVAGLEADIQFVDLGNGEGGGIRTAAVCGPQPIGAFGIGPVVGTSGGNVAFFDRRHEMDFFGTVRGRLGIAFDRALIYATGGLAWTSLDDNNGGAVPGVGFFQGTPAVATARRERALDIANRARTDSDDIGWTVGGGVEYAFTNNISAKIEGLYVNIGENDGGNNVVGVTNRGRAIRQAGGRDESGEFAVVRAGLNFRFGTW